MGCVNACVGGEGHAGGTHAYVGVGHMQGAAHTLHLGGSGMHVLGCALEKISHHYPKSFIK